MKKQMYLVWCTIIIILLPNVPGLLPPKTLEEIKNVSLNEDVPIWKINNSWNYNINRFQLNFSASNALISLDSSIDNLTIKLIGYTESSYILDLSGRINGSFRYESGEGMVLKGNLLFTKISGNTNIRKNDLANEKIHIFIKGIVVLTIHILQIPIPIPLPLTITINVNQSSPRSYIDFPLHDGKQGLINETTLTANIKIESIVLQILTYFINEIPPFIFHQETFNIPMLNYSMEKQNISVIAGIFDSYEVRFNWDIFGSIYYAPSVGNIVKAEAVIDIPEKFMVLLIGELKSYNFQ